MANTVTQLLGPGGRSVGVLADGVFHKNIDSKEHILRKPEPSIGIDKRAYDLYRSSFHTVEVFCTDSQVTYRIEAELFDTFKREIEFGKHGKQYVVPIRRWLQADIESKGQMPLHLEVEG